MTTSRQRSLGSLLVPTTPPAELAARARLAEELGFGELWLAETPFFYGTFAAAAAVLEATERITVGVGILPVVGRHPAVTAMELATLGAAYPDRFVTGFGLGFPSLLQQMGIRPRSPLTAIRECMTSVRRLVEGEEVTEKGEYFDLDGIRLGHPAPGPMPLHLGVIGPKALTLAGEIADGSVLSILASPTYVKWACERIAEGTAVGHRPSHRVTVVSMMSVDRDGATARRAFRPVLGGYLVTAGRCALTDVYGNSDELVRMIEDGGAATVGAEMPDEWLEDLAVTGDPEQCAAAIGRLYDAGADTVVVTPAPPDRADEMLRLVSAEVLPRMGQNPPS